MSEQTRRRRTTERTTAGVIITAVGVMLVAANLRPAVVSVGPLIGTISADAGGFGSAVAGLLTALPVLFFGISAPVAPRSRIGSASSGSSSGRCSC